eukprot:6192237-Pleurochrysis_carterae.AAC.2
MIITTRQRPHRTVVDDFDSKHRCSIWRGRALAPRNRNEPVHPLGRTSSSARAWVQEQKCAGLHASWARKRELGCEDASSRKGARASGRTRAQAQACERASARPCARAMLRAACAVSAARARPHAVGTRLPNVEIAASRACEQPAVAVERRARQRLHLRLRAKDRLAPAHAARCSTEAQLALATHDEALASLRAGHARRRTRRLRGAGGGGCGGGCGGGSGGGSGGGCGGGGGGCGRVIVANGGGAAARSVLLCTRRCGGSALRRVHWLRARCARCVRNSGHQEAESEDCARRRRRLHQECAPLPVPDRDGVQGVEAGTATHARAQTRASTKSNTSRYTHNNIQQQHHADDRTCANVYNHVLRVPTYKQPR